MSLLLVLPLAALAADPAALRGEAIGLGQVRLGQLRGRATSVLLMSREHEEAATPVGYALNAVMAAHDGHRVSAVDLSSLWSAARPLARPLLQRVFDDALERFAEDYARVGEPVPADLTDRAWLVADWKGAWHGALAPGCTGLAAVVLDRNSKVVDRLCDPSPSAAADRFKAVLTSD